MMRDHGHGTIFRSALSGEETRFAGYAFVDDNDMCHIARTITETGVETARALQDTIDCWEGGIWATGGAIVPEKSHWYLIDFTWSKGTWAYVNSADLPAVLYVRDTFGHR